VLEISIQKPNIALEEMMQKSKRLGEVLNLIEEKEFRWMELDEKQQ
jgi:hypothetical protein